MISLLNYVLKIKFCQCCLKILQAGWILKQVLASRLLISDNSRRYYYLFLLIGQYKFYGDPFGPLAMILCEFGQVRKEATAADDSCAEVWLFGLPPYRLNQSVTPSVRQYQLTPLDLRKLNNNNNINILVHSTNPI